MNLTRRLVSLGLALIGINLSTFIIVRINYNDGFYPPQADSTIIPIFSTGAVSVIAAQYLLALIFIPKLPPLDRLRSCIPKGVIISLLVLTHLPVLFACLIGAAYWAVPAHYIISLTYIGGIFVLTYWIATDIKRLLSNRSLDRRAAR